MEIRRINDIQYWADAGSLNYAGIDGEAGSIFTIMVYQMLTIGEEMGYPVVELIIYTKISGLLQKRTVPDGIKCLGKIQGNEVNIVILVDHVREVIH